MSTITSNTKKCYECCINRLKQEDIFPLIQKHPKLVINWINSSSSKTNSLSTQNSFISAILWYLRTEWPTTDLTAYTTESKRLQALRKDLAKKQILPEAKMSEMLEWNDVLKLKEKAVKELSKDDLLIYSFYTEMPPLRADFTNLQIYPRYAEGRAGNYIVSSNNLINWRIVLQEYKTSKTFGKQVRTLPINLILLIKEARKESGDKLLCMSENVLSKRVTSIFEKLSGKSMSINLLRHSYIKYFLSVKRTITEKEQLAKQMLHSKDLQERYDIITPSSTPSSSSVDSEESEHSLDFLA